MPRGLQSQGFLHSFLNISPLQLSLRKTARDLEKKDEQLSASRKVLEEQEDELLVSHVLLSSVPERGRGFYTTIVLIAEDGIWNL